MQANSPEKRAEAPPQRIARSAIPQVRKEVLPSTYPIKKAQTQ
jgi:hypothetical protein